MVWADNRYLVVNRLTDASFCFFQGNFHLFILFDKNKPEEFKEATRLNANLIKRAIAMEGSITGEHGVGFGKKKYLQAELGENTVELMRRIKAALDPNGILNPGKVLPDKE